MPAYNFKAQFAPAVEAGKKRCTIRGSSAKVGATAYLFQGLRTKACRRLGQGEILHCTPIRIGRDVRGNPHVVLGGKPMRVDDLYALAIEDGFETPGDFVDFFAMTYKKTIFLAGVGTEFFNGFLISWDLNT